MLALVRVIVAAAVLCAVPDASAEEARFLGLGDLPGGGFRSAATGVTPDGDVVVGSGTVEGELGRSERAFRWSAERGLENLGSISGRAGKPQSTAATAVSADGSTVVGVSMEYFPQSALGGGRMDGFLWVESKGFARIHPDPRHISWANDISADGDVVIGELLGDQGFRWTRTAGVVPFAHEAEVSPTAISADGSVIAGWLEEPVSGRAMAFRWTREKGIVERLGLVPGLDGPPAREVGWAPSSRAGAVSADGLVVSGWGGDESRGAVFRWTPAKGMVRIDPLPGTWWCTTGALSGDGAVMIGACDETPFIWDRQRGMRPLQEVLVALGADLAGWRLTSANDVSGDGRTIVGAGRNPQGHIEAWVAILPAQSVTRSRAPAGPGE